MKKRTTIFIFIVFCLTIFTVPEVLSVNPKKQSFHFEGKINSHEHIEMNLIKINDSVYGNYSIVSNGGSSTKFMVNKSYNPIQLYGKVNVKGVFTIRENPWAKGASFTGKFVDDQTLKGTWESEDGKINYPFELKTIPINAGILKGLPGYQLQP